MRKLFIPVILLLSSIVGTGPAPAIDTTLFKSKLDQLLADSVLLPATMGIEIFDPEKNEVRYSKNSEKLMTPASGVKLITALAGISLLKPEYRFKTEAYFDSKNLYIKGYGDPTLITQDLTEIVDKIIEQGIEEVDNLIYDDTYFDSQEIGEGWVEEPAAFGFNARISALSLNKNCIQLFVKPADRPGKEAELILYPNTEFISITNLASTGQKNSLFVESSPISDKNHFVLKGEISQKSKGTTFIRHIKNPSLYTATVFKELLEARGIKIKNQKILQGKVPNSMVPLYSHYSEPLVDLVYEMNKESVNFYADQIFKTLGAELLGEPGSFEKGRRKFEEFLKSIGLAEKEFRICDGSGLSRYNLISAHAVVKALAYALTEFEMGPEFLSSLPVSGIDGTLKNRLKWTSSTRKVRAKTGAMLGVSFLSGYVETAKDNLIIFSIIMNNYTANASQIKKIQDDIIALIITQL